MSKASFTSVGSSTYDHALWTGAGRWRGALAIVLLVVTFLLVSTVLTVAGALIDEWLGNTQPGSPAPITPLSLLAFNLSLAAQQPIAMLLQWLLYGVRPGWLSSVQGTFRWQLFGRLAVVLVPFYAIYVAFTFMVAPAGLPRSDQNTLLLLVIVLLTTPLQAAGEEYAVRGLVQRSASTWFRDGRVAFAVSTGLAALFFAGAHASADLWQISYYVVFGVCASVAARGTGGLEAAILMHSANNVFILAPLALTGGMAGLIQRNDEVSGAWMLIPMAVTATAAVISVWLARRFRTVTRSVGPLIKQTPASA